MTHCGEVHDILFGNSLIDVKTLINNTRFANTDEEQLTCMWTVQTAPGNRIRLKINTFDIEDGTDCFYADYINILTGIFIHIIFLYYVHLTFIYFYYI